MTDAKEFLEALDGYFTEKMSAEDMPGLSLAVTDRSATLHVRAMGFSDVSSRTPVTNDTLFQIGSISKSFAAILLLQLRERGKVDLNAPAKEYIPWFEVRSRYGPITLHHLMTHTAGIPMGSEATIAGETEVWELRNLEASAPPGELFHYSNTGYKAVGLVIEAVTGKPCDVAIEDRILKPLGMSRTHAALTNDIRGATAVGYTAMLDDRPVRRCAPLAPAPWFEGNTADGCISSVPEDMAAYVRMLLCRGEGPDGRVISEESFDLLTRRYVKPTDSFHGEHYGYGLNIEDADGHLLIWHTGGMVGFTSSLLADMDLGLGMIVMTNCIAEPETMSRHAMSTLRAAAEGGPLPEAEIHRHAFVPKDPAQFVGTYSGEKGSITVTASEGMLVASVNGESFGLEGIREDSFVLDHGSFRLFPLKFVREGGQVTEAVCGPDVYYLEPRVKDDTEECAPAEWSALEGHYRSHNPWLTNFRIVGRKGRLLFIDSSNDEEPLTPLHDGSFRVGGDPRSPERIRFDVMIGGKAFVAYLSGGYYQRVFTP